MVAALHRLSFTALRNTYRTPVRRKATQLKPLNRQFHRSPIYRAPKEEDEDDDDQADRDIPPDARREPFKFDIEDLSQEERKTYEALPPSKQEEWREEARITHEYMSQPHIVSELTGEVSKLANEYIDSIPRFTQERQRMKPGLMAMGEDNPYMAGEDPEFEGDDITSLAHGELEQHREMREYARLAVWEMPLLHSTTPPPTPKSISHRPLPN